VIVKTAVYLGVAPCSLLIAYQYFKVICYSHLQGHVPKRKLGRLFDDAINIILEDGIWQSSEISAYVSNVIRIITRDEFLKLDHRKTFKYHVINTKFPGQ
jgi:hypothetical protein